MQPKTVAKYGDREMVMQFGVGPKRSKLCDIRIKNTHIDTSININILPGEAAVIIDVLNKFIKLNTRKTE